MLRGWWVGEQCNCLKEWDFVIVFFNFQRRTTACTNFSFRTVQWEQLLTPLFLLELILVSLLGFAEAGEPSERCPELQEIGQNGSKGCGLFFPLLFSVSEAQLYFLSDLNYLFWIIKIQSKINIRLASGSYFLNPLIRWLKSQGCQVAVWCQSSHCLQLMNSNKDNFKQLSNARVPRVSPMGLSC